MIWREVKIYNNKKRNNEKKNQVISWNKILKWERKLDLQQVLQDLLGLSATDVSATLSGLGTADEGLVDVWNDTTARNSSFDEQVELFVSTNRKLQVTRVDTLHFEILTGVTRQLKHFSRQVLENSSCIDLQIKQDDMSSLRYIKVLILGLLKMAFLGVLIWLIKVFGVIF